MAVTKPLFINQVEYDAESERRGFAGLVAQGSAGVPRSGVLGPAPAVSLSGSTVQVGPFNAVIGSSKGAYLVAVDSVTAAGTVGVADATNGRLDRVVLEVLDPDNGSAGTTRLGRLRVVAGTAAAIPGLPALPPLSLHIGQVLVPKSGAGSPVVTVDAPLSAAAGAPVPVRSQAERDGLTKSVGLTVARMDAGGAVETWDGRYWSGSVKPTADAGWNFNGHLVRTLGAAGPFVTAGFQATYSGGTFAVRDTYVGAFTLRNTGFLPVADTYGYFTLRSGTGSRPVKADCGFAINSAGEMYVRVLLGQAATTITAGDELYFSTGWASQ